MKLHDLEAFKEIKGLKITVETREGWELVDKNAGCFWYKLTPGTDIPAPINCMFEGPDRFKNAVIHYLRAYPESRSSTT